MTAEFKRESMVFYDSFYEAIADLPAEEFKKCVCTLLGYGLQGKIPETKGIEKTIFVLAKPLIDKNIQRWNNAKKSHSAKKSASEEGCSDAFESETIETADSADDFPSYSIEEDECCEEYSVADEYSDDFFEEYDADEFDAIDEAVAVNPANVQVRNTCENQPQKPAEKQVKLPNEDRSDIKQPFGKYANVYLSVKEKAVLVRDYGVDKMLEAVDFYSMYLKSNPHYKADSHYNDIINRFMSIIAEPISQSLP